MNELEQARALFLRALHQHNLGRLAAAEPLYRQALALAPERVSVLLNLAVVLIGLGRHAEAEPLAARAAALDPASADAASALAECRRRLQGSAAALATLDAHIAAAPADADAHNQRGALLREAGDVDAAREAFDATLRVDPAHRAALANRAALRASCGEIDAALADYRAALARDPDFAPAGQGWVHLVLESGSIPDGPDADFDALLLRALEVPWTRPSMLGRVLARRIAADPRIAPLRARAVAAWPLPPLVADAETVPWCEALADSPLLMAWLARGVVSDPLFESVLTATRRVLARLAADPALAPDAAHPHALHCALAMQCAHNEHAWPIADDERALCDRLAGRLEAALAAGVDAAPALIAAVASYRPLIEVPGAARLLARGEDPALSALLAAQLADPLADRVAAARIPELTPVTDATSRAVARQYEAHPYPRWTALARPLTRIGLAEYATHRLGAPLPGPPLPVAAPRVLHAGCGTGEAPLDTALRLAGAEVLAIDLSRASLAYAQRMAARLGVDNLRFACADLLALGGLDERYDLIEAAGVLHHLAEPLAGLRVLAGLLAPRGVMRLALYSEAARASVVAARVLIEAEGLSADAAGMRRARALIRALPAGHPARGVMDYTDFYALSECRDLLFHVSERRCTLPQIATWLSEVDLELLGFELAPPWRRVWSALRPDPAARTDLGAWAAFEACHPAAFAQMYTFWVAPRGAFG